MYIRVMPEQQTDVLYLSSFTTQQVSAIVDGLEREAQVAHYLNFLSIYSEISPKRS